ncbi:hypothetical protein D9757_005993 [Collybiopsis confluens]|uniref:Derlin n=1 Tax=Collybiopsis confluens TaxID=2823264 RepID=A0A8H5HUK9_9AGAR|nr:hypothetical protein D9757_005993 [Collybiopsis confluens]
MDGFVVEIKKIPPVTRFLCISLISVSVPVMMQLVSPYKIVYFWGAVAGKFEIWRLWSSFFLGSGGINFIFEMVMLYRTSNELEEGPFARKSSDYACQLFIASGAIIITSIPLNSMLFLRPFLLCLVYLSSNLAPPGAQTSLYGLLTIPVRYFPFALLGMDLLMGGPAAAAQAVPGAIVGHLWWMGVFGTEIGGRGGVLTEWGIAPRWLKNWFGETGSPSAGRTMNAGGGVNVIPPRAREPENANTTFAHRWGSGNRLGNN